MTKKIYKEINHSLVIKKSALSKITLLSYSGVNLILHSMERF